ncbi:MAG TPA: hypothetical protein VF691_08350 [Cytophagaceae bacterium]
MKTKVLIPLMFASTFAFGQSQSLSSTCEVKPPYSREYYCGQRSQSGTQPLGNLFFSPHNTGAWKPSPVITPSNNSRLLVAKNSKNQGRRLNGSINFSRGKKSKCDGRNC